MAVRPRCNGHGVALRARAAAYPGQVPLTLRVIAGSVLVLAGILLLTVGVLGAGSRLRRNRWIGIRTAATLRSDAAFAHGHRAGAVPAAAAGAVALVGGAAVLLGGDAAAPVWVVLVISVIGAFGLACVAAVVGDRAAAAVAVTATAPQGCLGACAGCDLVAGCRDRAATPGEPTNQPATGG